MRANTRAQAQDRGRISARDTITGYALRLATAAAVVTYTYVNVGRSLGCRRLASAQRR